MYQFLRYMSVLVTYFSAHQPRIYVPVHIRYRYFFLSKYPPLWQNLP
jgi:hypothetical protein